MAKKQQAKAKEEELDLAALAEKSALPSWELAGLMQAAGWAPGKQITETAFNDALKRFRNRPLGGGRIV